MPTEHDPPTMTPGPPNRPTGRTLGRKVAISVAFGMLVFAALSAYADFDALGARLQEFSWGAFVIGLGWATGNYVLRWVRWEYYLRRLGIRVKLSNSALVFLAGFIMSITPGKLGEVYKSWLLYELDDHPISRTAPIVIAERLTDLLALVLLTGFGALAFPQGLWIAVAGLAFVLVVLAACTWGRLGHALIRLTERVPLISRFTPALTNAYGALRELMTPGPLLTATVISTLSWFMECLSLYYIVQGFGSEHLDIISSTFAYSGPTIVGALAMLPGGLGLTEATMAGTLQAMNSGLGPATATAVTILVRLATLWWAVLLGALALIPLQRRIRARLRRP